MKTVFKKIGILTSGGDAPGMNAAIRAVARTSMAHGVEVVGIYRGYSGLIAGDIRPFDIRAVSNIVNRGGTMLYSDRCPEFKTEEGMQKAIATCRREGIDGIVAIGGDGTFRGATDLTKRGIPCVGIPGTIDNDIASTDFTIGFDTAMNTVIDMVDRLRDTCESHARCNVVEVMGRDAGDIALQTAIASGATAVVIGELPSNDDAIIEKIRHSREIGKRNFIILVSEGKGHDYGASLTERIERETGVESRFARLSHVVRGGSPTLRDRLLASRMGEFAANQLLEGKSDIVICERNGEICATDIHYALILDRMFKAKLKDGDLDSFTKEEVASMRERCKAQNAYKMSLYKTVNLLGL